MASVSVSTLIFGPTFLFCTLLIFVQYEQACGQVIQDYPHYRNLDGAGNYVVQWGHNSTDIEFVVAVKTLGYVGFGISRDGSMFPADMVIGWLIDGSIYFGDYHTINDRVPVMDQNADWHVLDGYETNGTTVLRFTRKLDTCDSQDEKITHDTMRIIFSWHTEDPDVATGMVPYHGATQRGSTYSVLLENDSEPEPGSIIPESTFELPITNYQYPIPATGSTRLCIVLDMTGSIPKSHVIKYEPIITPGSEAYVYRMILYQCDINVTAEMNARSYECETEAPKPVKSCKSILAVWAKGGQPLHLPPNVGIPVGGSQNPPSLVLEIHYTNFEMVQGIQDSSGIKLTFTTQLRQHEAGLMELGTVITKGWKAFIPGGEGNFRSKSYCSPRCMAWGFGANDTAINAIGLHYHGNDVATGMKLRHFRGRNELPWISEDNAFTNMFQATRLFKNSVRILQDDTLSLECMYDTSQRLNVTRGGWSRKDEMCRATLLYYPRKPIDMCLSWSSFDKLDTNHGEKVAGQSSSLGSTGRATNTSDITDILQIKEGKAMEYLSNITVWDAFIKKKLIDALETSTERILCSAQQRKPAYAIDRFNQPALQSVYVPPISSCPTVQVRVPLVVNSASAATGTGSSQTGNQQAPPPFIPPIPRQ